MRRLRRRLPTRRFGWYWTSVRESSPGYMMRKGILGKKGLIGDGEDEPGSLAVDTLSLGWTDNHVLDLGSVLENENGVLLAGLGSFLAGVC